VSGHGHALGVPGNIGFSLKLLYGQGGHPTVF